MASFGEAIMRFYALGNDDIVGEFAQDQAQQIVAKLGENLGLDALSVDFGTGCHCPILHVGKLPHAFLVDKDSAGKHGAFIAGNDSANPVADHLCALLAVGLRLPMA